MSRSLVGRVERGQADRLPVRTLDGIVAALGARIDVRLLWQGEGLDRLLDARHASLVDRTLNLLVREAWTATTEVSFNVRGERGAIDILAHHEPTGCLLVVEVKSVVPDLQAMLAALDRKSRLGAEIARERGWHATAVARLLVLPDDRTTRRRVEALATTFQSTLPARTVEVRRWIRDPGGVKDGILFLSDEHQVGTRHRVPGQETSRGRN